MKLHLKIWRQNSPKDKGAFVTYELDQLSPDMSFLDMLDVLNEKLILNGKIPVEFDHDCREGICGQCGIMINARAHGPLAGTTTCQLHLRSFEDNMTLYLEPFRAKAFPILKDLKIDRSSFDRIIQSGGYISAKTGSAPEANALAISHEIIESAFDSASCIGCGACVATCKNASAALFTGAKVSHLAKLPQGKVEAPQRVVSMVTQMDEEGFGHCTNTGACEAECPQNISLENIARLNLEYIKASIKKR